MDPFSQHLSGFVFHNDRLQRYRSVATQIDDAYFFNRSGTAIVAVSQIEGDRGRARGRQRERDRVSE